MKVSLSDFEYDFVGVFFLFLRVIIEFLKFFLIGLNLGRYGFELGNGLFGDDELGDDFFKVAVKVVLFGVGRGDIFKSFSDGSHDLNVIDLFYIE